MAQDFSTWAILNASDRPICDYVGIVSCSLAEAARVLTEPLEGGNLAAYNKVQAPDAVSLSLALDGDPATQTQALNALRSLKQAIGTDSLCKLVTPYFVVENLALETISQSRSVTQNASSLIVELGFITIRAVQTGTRKVVWSPRNPTSSDEVSAGKVQPKTLAAKLAEGLL